MALEVGEIAPEFTLPDQNGVERNITQYLGKIVILYFYPEDDTPGCVKEACTFRDAFAEYRDLGVVILGVSRDSIESHERFREKYHLNFDLLADPSGKVHELYDVIKLKNVFGKKFLGTVRTTYIIDQDGKIRAIFPLVKVDQHNKEILAAVKNISTT